MHRKLGFCKEGDEQITYHSAAMTCTGCMHIAEMRREMATCGRGATLGTFSKTRKTRPQAKHQSLLRLTLLVADNLLADAIAALAVRHGAALAELLDSGLHVLAV